jgi:(1->4)-alpha-D-glucan 1-alpha-D-glucosylmutase
MNGRGALDQLCAHYGIADSYRDIEGREHQPPDTTRRALLQGMGVVVGDAATEKRALQGAIECEWRRILPPVAVVWEDADTLLIPLTLPESGGDWPLRWRLTQEGGDTSEGALDLGPVQIEERREIRGRPWVLRTIRLQVPSRIGYHRLELFSEIDIKPLASLTVIAAPHRCYQPEGVGGERRAWGLTTQLHALRSGRNWGIGDFTDLTRLVELTADAGAGVVALTPLHALFPFQPERCNPYAPSSRTFLNVLHIDVEAIPELAEYEQAQSEILHDDFQALLRALRSEPLVDYTAVARAKFSLFGRLYRYFCEHHLPRDSARARGFLAFREAQGEDLERFALFEALSEHFATVAGGPVIAADWPEPYRRPRSEEVAAFAAAHSERIDFFAWLQWLGHLQLQAAGRRSLALHLALGLCQDLAVGVAPDGADVWSAPDLFLQGAHVGAPADEFSPRGQDWGVLAWRPKHLRASAYRPFITALRASMRDAGALRIDHVMGLMRLFLIPAGASPSAGTYVSYPFEDLLGVLALESVRNRCLIIGEDLGTVPGEVRAGLGTRGVLSFRLLYFERGPERGFLRPGELEPQAVVSAATHDLPTLDGFWQGTDLEQRRALELFADEHQYEVQLLQRSEDRTRLFLALEREELLPQEASADPVAVPALTPRHIQAIYTYLARAPCRLLLVQTADLLGQTEQVNLPGSGDAYPSWRQRQPLELESWRGEPRVEAVLAGVREERGISAHPPPPAREGQRAALARARIPRATYRLQLHAGFGFAAAAELVPYLARVGVSHCYFSPYLAARAGSTHGYDVIAHDRLNPELGSRQDYQRLCDALADHGMGQILDMVPNHVGIMGADNGWWLDVLENGSASAYAGYFDIDWEPLRQELRGKVLIPVLGDHYGNVLDTGELELVFDNGAFRIQYHEHHFPVDPREYPAILAPGLVRLRERLGDSADALARFESLVTAFGNLPARRQTEEKALTERRRDKELHKQRLAELCAADADIHWYVQECLRDFNGAEDYPADVGRLHDLLEAQAYRLAHWRVAADEINYRRFFDINDLAALRMENPDAFEATHGLVLDLIAEGRLAGLRIDHPDGLYDPANYFREIQERVLAGRHTGPEGASEARPLYLIVEKVLTGDEQLPPDWQVHGTTGYDFAAHTDALFVDPEGAGPLDRCYRDFAGAVRSLPDEIYAAKRLVMRNMLSSELHVLASELSRIAEADPHTRDFTLDALRDALVEVVACFPVYRTYITPRGVSGRDRNQMLKAVSEARRQSGAADLSVFDFVRDVLLTDIGEGKPEAYRTRVLRLAMKFQQYTGPVTAKGVEDTAWYRYHRLVSLNEVGGAPDRFGLSIDAFHRASVRRRRAWPHAMLAGSTHDSKRSEDVRARLHVLSELTGEWREHVERWALLNRRFRSDIGGLNVPDANTEYLLYQTLVGVWPLGAVAGDALAELRERITAYMDKAVKEAKVHTAWTNADEEYDAALSQFVSAVLTPTRNGAFFDDFLPFQRRIARVGLFNALSQTLLRLTCPGVPDLYQGNEVWTFNLVDPDNRRPVDFGQRATLLDGLDAGLADGTRAELSRVLSANLADGRVKLYLIRRALALRAADPELFAHGDYRPLHVEGPHAERLCAFVRNRSGRSVVVLAPRLLAGLMPPGSDTGDPFADPGWARTLVEVPARDLEDVLTGVSLQARPVQGRHLLAAADVLRRFPAGLLTAEGK